MKKKKPSPATELTIAIQIKLTPETRENLKRVAAINGLSLNDVGTMAIAAGLGVVEAKLSEIHSRELVAA